LELSIGIVFEFLIQLLTEFLFERLFRMLSHLFNWWPADSVLLSFFNYIVLGTLAGGLSLLAFPRHYIHDPTLKLDYLLVAPLTIGVIMTLNSYFLKGKGVKLVKMDTFSYGTIFALFMSFIRFVYAK
jgi:hypothetical protein